METKQQSSVYAWIMNMTLWGMLQQQEIWNVQAHDTDWKISTIQGVLRQRW